MNLTKSEILLEFGKCLRSPIYAIETYLETFDKTQEGNVPFKLFPRQKEIVTALDEHRFNLISKPRQAGVSSTTAAYMSILVACAAKENPEAVLIIANKQEMAFEFLGKIKEYLTQLPRWFWGSDYYGTAVKESKSIFQTESKKEIKLPNGSRVKAVATSKDALRGFTPTYLIMDEAAYIDNGKEVFGAALTALGTGGKSVLISTPNGMDELYYKTYELSKAGKNGFHIVEMKWYEDLRYNKDLRWLKHECEEVKEIEFTYESYNRMLVDGYKPTSSWYEEMCQGMNNDARMIAQELDVSFIGSGGNVINEADINYQEVHNVQDPVSYSGEEDELWVWKEPEEGHQYIMGVDVARGDGEDLSTICVLDVTTMEQVLEYEGKIQPDLLGYKVKEIGDAYEAYTVVDITGGMGVPTVLKLLELGYDKLHYDSPSHKILATTNNNKLSSYKKEDNKTPGFTINTVRIPLVNNLEEKIRNNIVKIRSRRCTSQMKTFVYKNGRADHMHGYHDDLLFALGMCLWVIEYSFKKLKKVEKQTRAMLGSWMGGPAKDMAQDELDRGTGFVPRNLRNKKALAKPNFSPLVAKNMQDPSGKYLWLFSGSK